MNPGLLARALAGETACGDVAACIAAGAPWANDVADSADSADAAKSANSVDEDPGRWLLVADGLGHGPLAAAAAQRALQTLQALAAEPALAGRPLSMLRHIDLALADTRGAAVGLCWLQGRRLRHAGIGNTRTLRWRAGHMQRLPSQYGIVGDGELVRRSQRSDDASGAADSVLTQAMQELELQPGDWLLMFSDGLAENMSLPVMLPEWEREPQALCRHLLAQWGEARDDAAVLAWRQGTAG